MRVLHARIIDANRGFVNGATAEIGLMLGISGRSAEYLVETGYELTARSLVWQALHDGLIDALKARKIVTLLDDVPDPNARNWRRSRSGTPPITPRPAAPPPAADDLRRGPQEKLRDQALARRHVSVILAGHGMAYVSIYASLEHAQAFMRASMTWPRTRPAPTPTDKATPAASTSAAPTP